MPIPGIAGAGSGVGILTGTSTVDKSGCTEGNVLVMHTFEAGAANDSSRSNITNIEGLDGQAGELMHTAWRNVGDGTAGHHLLSFGRAIADGTCSVDLTVGGSGGDVFARIYEFADVITTVTPLFSLDGVVENIGGVDDHYDFGADVNGTISDIQVVTSAANRLACNFLAISAVETVGAFTGETGGDWLEAVGEYQNGSGTTATLQLQIAEMASAGEIDGGSLTLSGSQSWGIQGLALIGTVSTTATVAWLRA